MNTAKDATVTGLRIRVVLADDTPAMLTFLRELVDDQPDMELVAVARDTQSAIEMARTHRPNVIVLDVRMPGGGGEVAARSIRETDAAVRIVALSSRSEQAVIDGMLAAGANAYVIKGPNVNEILNSIRSAP